MKRLTRNAVVGLLVAYGLVSVFATASTLWRAPGTIGLSVDYDAKVRAISPEGPAALAGLSPGDRIELAATPFAERRFVAGVGSGAPIGTRVHVRFVQRGVTRDVWLTAIPATMTGADRSSLLLQCLASLIFVAVGASLILLRPSLATWGFGLYCLILLPTSAHPLRLPSARTALAATFLFDVVQNVGVVGLLVFALEFPRPYETLWRERVRRSIPALFLVLAAMTLYPDVANLILGRGAEPQNRLLQAAFGIVFGLALFILYDTYRRIALDERERLRWVLLGFGAGMVTNYVGNTLLYSSLIPIGPPVWLVNMLVSLSVLLPLTVAHAVVRHRVLEIDFVVGRALVYATLTTIIAALFGLLDWGFGHLLEDFRLSRLVEAGVAIGIAFAFDTFHKRTEGAIESIFFRKRRAAEARLDRLVRELPQARAAKVVEEALIAEVVDALEVTSAALFVESRTGFIRTASYGWRDGDCAVLDDSDLLVLSLRSEKRSVGLAELPWRRADVPADGVAPVAAVPLHARDELAGIALYGAHPGGADLDPRELAQLERLAHAAAVAFDELEAERLRLENDRQIAAIRELKARLDELRRLHPLPSVAVLSSHPLETGGAAPLT